MAKSTAEEAGAGSVLTAALDETVVPGSGGPSSSQVGGPPRGRRSALSILSALLGILALVSSVVIVWAYATFLTTNGWLATVGPLAADPRMVDAVSAAVADELVGGFELQDRVGELLPPRAAFLAVPLSMAARAALQQLAAQAMATEEFHTLWVATNEVLHGSLIRLLRGETPRVRLSESGALTLNLYPAIDRVLDAIRSRARQGGLADRLMPGISDPTDPDAARAELSASLGIGLPPGFGEVELIQSDLLARLRRLVGWMDVLVVALPLVALGCLALALWTAADRAIALAWMGLGSAGGMLVVRLLLRLLGERIAAVDGGPRAAVAAAFLSGLLSHLALWCGLALVAGLAVALVAGAYARRSWLRWQLGRLARTAGQPPTL